MISLHVVNVDYMEKYRRAFDSIWTFAAVRGFR